MEELLDVLDKYGIKTGQVLPRSEFYKKGLWHRAIIVAIVNKKNEILLQKRSAIKSHNANMWDISVAGHVSTGQDSLSAAAREINEEVSVNLGFHVEVKDFRYMFSFKKEQDFSDDYLARTFYDFFILREPELCEEKIKFQTSEVQAIKFVNMTELSEMRKSGDLVPREECYNALAEHLFRL
jgi:Isopentenyldiphosphate isomerase